MSIQEISSEIKRKILETGASDCGFAKAEKLQREFDFLKQWLNKKYHAEKKYLEQNPERRANPEMLVPGAKTVIAVLYNYYIPDDHISKQHYKISRYAFGQDYHEVLNKKLNTVAEYIKEKNESQNTYVFVDSAPIFEKAWAHRAGLGWIGKNTLLINENTGSYHFIGLIVTDVELQFDDPVEEKCGGCNLCIDACPTGALVGQHELDIRLCISHLTQQKNPLPVEFKDKFNNFIYGCDICQEVCPWNKYLKPTSDNVFQLSDSLKNMSKESWENLNEEKFLQISEHSAIRRIGFSVLKRNIDFLKQE